MTAAIASALASGYSSRQLVNHLLRMFPQHRATINNALSAGYSADAILSFLTEGRKGLNKYSASEGKTEFEQVREREISKEEARNKKALLGAGALAVGGLGAGMAASALSRAAPQILPPLARAAPQLAGPGATLALPANQAPQAPVNPTPSPVPQAPIAPVQGQAPTPQAPIEQPINPTPSPKITEIFKKLNANEKVDQIIKAGNGPDQVEGFFKKFHPNVARDIEKASGMSLKDAVTAYLSENSAHSSAISEQSGVNSAQSTPETKVSPTEQAEKSANLNPNVNPLYNETETPVESVEQKPIAKNDVVSSSHGPAEVLEIRGDQAIIEADGKRHKVDVEDLEPSSFTEDEIADAYDDLFSKIPEEHRSGFIQWAGYDEDRNVLGFIPRGGKYEELTNITPEEAHKIKEGKGVARTSGEVREGLWVAGEDTRGGVISQIIQDRKKKNKELEGRQGKFDLTLPKLEKEDRGMKPIFDELAYPRNLSKERDKKKAQEERAKKKKEKDEAKKRKK